MIMENRYNSTLLDAELRAEGLAILGCSSQGRIDWKKPPSEVERKKAEAVLKAHNPKSLPPRESKLEALRSKRRQGKALSEEEMREAIDFSLGV
jgi:hypothetical protein